MKTYALGQLTTDQLRDLVDVDNAGMDPAIWEARERGTLSATEQTLLAALRENLVSARVTLFNEATLWGRAIYPLLMMAERRPLHAYAQVPMSASLPRGELRGEVDGALAHEGLGAEVTAPYLLVVEAKRGVENHDPVAQLIGGLVCAAWQNQRDQAKDEQRLAGAYTVSDLWTFVEARVTGLDGELPKVRVVFSREYTEKTEAGAILCILKALVAEML
jgi:hypothetical protein